MHEVALMAELLRQVEESVREHPAHAVRSIRLAVGALSGVDADALRSAFHSAAPGTVVEEALLEIEDVPVTVACAQCQTLFSPDDYVFLCPHCDTLNQHALQGTDLTLVSLELIADD